MKKRRVVKEVSLIREDIRVHFEPDLKQLLFLKGRADINKLFQQLEQFVQTYFRGISSTQLRKLIDLTSNKNEVSLLVAQRPRIAHMIAKQPKEEAKYFPRCVLYCFVRNDIGRLAGSLAEVV